VGGSNIQGSHRLSQWLLTQGWRDCAACDINEMKKHQQNI